ncbi:MAG TPA: PD-(D/E)XK nuclease family protein [Candidatus Krumholzibacteria bacterium]|nr:PD-(D/E)XK nuclease family protein [Candidatus Krumholzibacteria bacterium]
MLREISYIPLPLPTAPTLLEVLGVERKELAASHLLAFFLAPDGPHGLEDLMLRSLLAALNEDGDQSDWADVSVRREVVTDAGTLIDILVETDDLVLCIENKLFATVYNDLPSYSRYVSGKAQKQRRRPRCVLLHLEHLPQAEDLHSFHPVSYDDLLCQIESGLGARASTADPLFLTLLLDFVRTIRRLKEAGVAAAPEFIEYVRKHEKEVAHLLSLVEGLDGNLRRMVEEVHQAVDNYFATDGRCRLADLAKGHSSGQLYDSMLYRVPANGDGALLLGVRVRPSGWSLRIKPISQTIEEAQIWLKTHKFETEAIPDEANRLRFRNFNFNPDADPTEVGRAVAERLLAILRANNSVKS